MTQNDMLRDQSSLQSFSPNSWTLSREDIQNQNAIEERKNLRRGARDRQNPNRGDLPAHEEELKVREDKMKIKAPQKATANHAKRRTKSSRTRDSTSGQWAEATLPSQLFMESYQGDKTQSESKRDQKSPENLNSSKIYDSKDPIHNRSAKSQILSSASVILLHRPSNNTMANETCSEVINRRQVTTSASAVKIGRSPQSTLAVEEAQSKDTRLRNVSSSGLLLPPGAPTKWDVLAPVRHYIRPFYYAPYPPTFSPVQIKKWETECEEWRAKGELQISENITAGVCDRKRKGVVYYWLHWKELGARGPRKWMLRREDYKNDDFEEF